MLETHQGKVNPQRLFPLCVLLMPSLGCGHGKCPAEWDSESSRFREEDPNEEAQGTKKSQEDLREGRAWKSYSRKTWMNSQALLEAAHV